MAGARYGTFARIFPWPGRGPFSRAQFGAAAERGEDGGRALTGDAADAVAAMEDETRVARKIGYLFDQAVAKLHTLGEHSPDLEASGAAAARAVHRIEPQRQRSMPAKVSPKRDKRPVRFWGRNGDGQSR